MINRNLNNIIFILSLFIYSSIASQDCAVQNKPNWGNDSLSCRQNVSLYSEFLKQKNWTDASIAWWKAQKVCPMYKTNLYKNGTAIYGKIASAKKKEKAADLNMTVDIATLSQPSSSLSRNKKPILRRKETMMIGVSLKYTQLEVNFSMRERMKMTTMMEMRRRKSKE